MPAIPTSAADRKQALRARMLAGRAGASPVERASASQAIAARLEALPAWTRARTVALYAPMGAEVDTGALARSAVASGKRVVWPRLAPPQPAMVFAACDLAELVPGPARALEPPPSAPVVPAAEIDLVLVPGVAFDVRCGRLGRGRGHYDATLAALPPAAFRAGLAFESQVVPEVPREPHDVPLDAVVTEARVLLAGRGPG